MARRAMLLLATSLAMSSSPILAQAAETVTYTYDAKGRLIKVVRTGTVNNNVQTTYSHDRADNRTNTTTTGSPNNSPPP